MKIIEILNKIVNGEEVPEKIKYCGDIWEKVVYIDCDEEKYIDYVTRCCDDTELKLFEEHILKITALLNDEVEIVEEPKKIEKIIMCFNTKEKDKLTRWYEKLELEEVCKHNFDVLHERLNEVIDKINEMSDKNENNRFIK